MIKEDKVLVKINIRNITSFVNKGYDITLDIKEYPISISDLNPGTKVKVTAICEICGSENTLQYNKYLMNINRNNKGYYSCFKCKNVEKEKTCIRKYGVKSYSMTEEFKVSESLKWKGTRKGDDSYKKTMLDRYGVDCYFKLDEIKNMNREWMSSDEFKNKSKKTMLNKYGEDHFSKTELFKNKISENKDVIVENIKKTFLEKYGVDWYFKTEDFKKNLKDKRVDIIESIKKTCLEKYGFDNVSKVKSVKDKIKKTRTKLNQIIPDELLTEWKVYKKNVRNLTKVSAKILYEKWDGLDYYDGEFIKGYSSYSHVHRYYPTIDHKISVYYGFINNISPEEISDINNLCITKRFINSKKRDLIESEFKLDT
jgi:hypothetical protein